MLELAEKYIKTVITAHHIFKQVAKTVDKRVVGVSGERGGDI